MHAFALTATGAAGPSKVRSCFNSSCRPWRDTRGHRIEAHGGILLHHADAWWWFGETAKLETGYLKCQPWCADVVAEALGGVRAQRPWYLSTYCAHGRGNCTQMTQRTICHGRTAMCGACSWCAPYAPAPTAPATAAEWSGGGVALYSSAALHGPWTPEGVVLTRATIAAALHVDAATVVVERPKVLYNPATRGFVLWFHLDNTKYTLRRAGVATASSPRGPWTFRGSVLPDGLPSLDLSLFADSDGSAYLVRSVNNTYTGISRLNAEFTDTAPGGMLSTLDVSWAPGRGESFVSVGRAALAAAGGGVASAAPLIPSRGRSAVEGMALFRLTNGSYYMVASHMRGWDPNPLMLFRADGPSLEDPRWVHLGNPTHDELSHHSQPAYVVEVRGSSGAQAFMYMGDNWLHAGRRALRDAGYVWLPFRLAPHMMHLWKLRQWDPRQYGLAPTSAAAAPGRRLREARGDVPSRRSQARAERRAARRGDGGGSGVEWTARRAAKGGGAKRAAAGGVEWAIAMGVLSRESAELGAARTKESVEPPAARRRRLRELYTRQQRGLPFGAGGQGARTTVRFVVDEAFAASQRGEEADLFGVPCGSRCGDGATAMAYKSLWWWRLAPERIRARYYVKTDDDALVHLPTLARVTRAFDAEGSGLHFAGDVNWGTFDLTRLHGHCWSMLPLGSLQFKPSQCAGEHGPVPFATGSLEVMSSAVVLNLTLTLDRLGWLAQRDDLNSYYEDRLVGLAVAHDARPIRLTYLNTHDHFDKPSGMPFVRAASGQPALLYEHEGPGGLLVSHHVRTAAAFAAAIDAQRPAVQAARAFSLECAPFAAAAAAERERMPAAVGAERAGGFPRELREWRVCAPTFEYSLGSPNLGHCGATAGEGDCAAGERGAWNTTAKGIGSLDACRARCKACGRCRYLSYSAYHEDCSWYHRCELGRLSLRWAGYSYVSEAAQK